ASTEFLKNRARLSRFAVESQQHAQPSKRAAPAAGILDGLPHGRDGFLVVVKVAVTERDGEVSRPRCRFDIQQFARFFDALLIAARKHEHDAKPTASLA